MAAANPDGFDHSRGTWSAAPKGKVNLRQHWEDQVDGGDRDYNDNVFTVSDVQPKGGTTTGAATYTYMAQASDVDGDALAYSLLLAPQGASINAATGEITWVNPLPGQYDFKVQVSDGQGGAAIQTYTLLVKSATPQATVNQYSADKDTRLTGNVLRNDFALENDALTAVLISGPAHGTLTLAANGDFVYTPKANYNGTDKFIYKARSQSGAETLATEVNINLKPINDAPTGTSQTLTTLEDTAIVLDLMGAFQDVDGDALTLSLVSQPGLGTLTPITTGPNAGKWLYTPKANMAGRDSFALRVWDGKVWSNTIKFTVNITAVNDAPLFEHDVFVVSATNRTLLDLDSGLQDADGDCVRIVSFEQPQHGTVTKDRYGNYYYKPATGYQGADNFRITLSDGKVSSTATVNLQVGPSTAGACKVSFQAQPAAQNTATSSTGTSSYVVVSSSATTSAAGTTTQTTILWGDTTDGSQLQAPVSVLSSESTAQAPSLAEQTGLVITL